jgi:hypothetical protein
MASNLTGQWKVSFETPSGVSPSAGSDLVGEIHLWARGWMVLMDHSGTIVGARHLAVGELIKVGSTIHFSGHSVKVTHCDFGPKDLSTDLEVCDPVSSSAACNLLWKVTYSTTKDLSRDRFNTFDGTMHLWIADLWLILKNAKNVPIAVKLWSKKQSLKVGCKINFPNYVVRVGVCLSGDPSTLPTVKDLSPHPAPQLALQMVLVDQGELSDSKSEAPSTLVTTTQNSTEPVSAVHSSLSMGVDFTPGMNFAKEIKRLFHSTVHPSGRSKAFTMVVSFGRASFRLDVDSVAIALESAIGGFCGSLNVQPISERVFTFRVASKNVGFHIIDMRWFSCNKFKCFFHLWSDGGPNWRREFSSWQKECAQEWTLVSPSKRTVQLGYQQVFEICSSHTV